MLRLPTEGDGAFIFDETGFAKQGQCPVGVARQDSGTLGKTGNCQVTVNCHSAERTIAWPVTTRLSLLKDWAHNADRREKAKVPEDLAFRTGPQIALDLLDRTKAWGVRRACMTADADSGDNPNFLGGLEQRRRRSVVAVRADCAVTLARRGGKARRTDVLVAAQRRGRGPRWRGGKGASVSAHKTCNEFPTTRSRPSSFLNPCQCTDSLVFSLWMKSTNKIRFYMAANTESEFIASFVSGDTRAGCAADSSRGVARLAGDVVGAASGGLADRRGCL